MSIGRVFTKNREQTEGTLGESVVFVRGQRWWRSGQRPRSDDVRLDDEKRTRCKPNNALAGEVHDATFEAMTTLQQEASKIH